MLENRMIIGTPGDYYNSPFERNPIESWTCPTCGAKWNLYDQYDAEQSAFPWEHEDSRGYTKVSRDPRMNGCCDRCALNTASCETLSRYVEQREQIQRVVEEFASEQKWLRIMWDALLNCDDKQSLRDELAELIEYDCPDDFIEWRADQ